jgi:hypothetical protein
MARGTILFIGGLLALLAAFAFKQVLIAIPSVPEAAAPGAFDTHRAFARLERILGDQQPHPVDSPGSDGVRERLVAEMRAAGLSPRVSDEMVCSTIRHGRNVNCARVRNLVATIGPAEGEHLLFVAHYDSVPVGPGAADDGIGIAAMLEVAEQLRGQPLQRPITFLFNEGEESGLLGARAFLDRDPAAARVITLVNLEARGVDGPAIMFETSRPNAPAINIYRASVDRPVANSLSTDFYRLLPNSTDVTVFEERPWTILNVAIIGNEPLYHTAGDNLAALDRRSLQHMGAQALGVARQHVSGEPPGGSGELIYADVLTRHLIAMPLGVGLALLGIIVVLLGYAVVRRRAFSALLPPLGAVIGAGLAAWLLTSLVQWLRPGEFWRAYPMAMQVAVAATALVAIAAALVAARRMARDALRAATWFLFALAGGASCLVAPGGAIFFLLAPLIVLAGILAEHWRPGAERIAGWIAAVVQLLTLLPTLALVDILLSTSPGWIVAPLLVLAALPLLVELRPEEGVGHPAWLAGAALALAAWAAVLIVPAYSQERQQIFTIEYVRDFGTGRAQWGVYSDGAPVPEAYRELREWERTAVPYASRNRWMTGAPVEDSLRPPRVVKVGEQPVPGGRSVRVRVEMNGWDRFQLDLPASARPIAMRADRWTPTFGDGKGDGAATVRCVGRSCDGFTFDLIVGSSGAVDARLIGNVARLPAAAAPLVQNRPEHARPQYVPDASYVLVPVRL